MRNGLRQLKAAGEPEPGALMRRYAVEPAAVEHDIAAVVVQRAAQAVDEGALARAVRADQPEPFARGDGEIDAVERDKPAKPLAEPARLEHGGADLAITAPERGGAPAPDRRSRWAR